MPRRALRITEIMYNAEGADTGKEYVRISNTGSEDIDTSGLVLSEHGRERRIQSKGITLSPGDNAVIVGSPDKFAEHYTYSGTVLDSTNYALNNTGSTLILILNGENLHTITIQQGRRRKWRRYRTACRTGQYPVFRFPAVRYRKAAGTARNNNPNAGNNCSESDNKPDPGNNGAEQNKGTCTET